MKEHNQTPINWREFLNSTEEVHALCIGWAEVVCPWPPAYKVIAAKHASDLANEPHYYRLGRALGIFTWFGMIYAILELIL